MSHQVSLVFNGDSNALPLCHQSCLIDVRRSLSSFFSLSLHVKTFSAAAVITNFLGSSWQVSRITWCLGFLHPTLTQVTGLRPLPTSLVHLKKSYLYNKPPYLATMHSSLVWYPNRNCPHEVIFCCSKFTHRNHCFQRGIAWRLTELLQAAFLSGSYTVVV